MHVVALLMFSLVGMGVVAALAAALYAALPRRFLECAELHGRFHRLGACPADEPRSQGDLQRAGSPHEAMSNGTPTEALPDGMPGGQFA
jgi:hypothetical protein